MIKYVGGKKGLMFRASGAVFERGADDGEGFAWKIEKTFDDSVKDWDYGGKGMMFVELESGTVWKRTWVGVAEWAEYG